MGIITVASWSESKIYGSEFLISELSDFCLFEL
jgi:hypothetical protein